jgi:hypothetical protein
MDISGVGPHSQKDKSRNGTAFTLQVYFYDKEDV